MGRPIRNLKATVAVAAALAALTLPALISLACAPPQESNGDAFQAATQPPMHTTAATVAVVTALPPAQPTDSVMPLPTAEMALDETRLPVATALPASGDRAIMTVDAQEAERTRSKYESLLRATWATDFTRTTIAFDEIMTGGPPKDGIPAIDDPKFESVADADEWLDDREAVQVVNLNGDARAYPVQVMVWHELVNDTVGGEPVVITY